MTYSTCSNIRSQRASWEREAPSEPRSSLRRRSGFTLVEMLVVMGILLALLGILLPAVNRAYKQGLRMRMAADMVSIATALESYKADHGFYPPVTVNGSTEGAKVLLRALIAPADVAVDGYDGLGFRTRPAVNGVPQGKPYGPYLKSDTLKWSSATAGAELLDRYSKPILYFPGKQGIDPSRSPGHVVNGGMFDPRHNSVINVSDLRRIAGDTNANGLADVTESPFRGPFLLVSSGPDEVYGPKNAGQPFGPANRCDDVANFSRGEY